MYKASKDMALPALATGNVDVTFQGTPDGEVYGVEYQISGTLISQTAGTVATKNPTGDSQLARGSDDVDAFLSAFLTSMSWNLDGVFKPFDAIDPTVLRTLLYFLLLVDFAVSGALLDGTTMNATGGATKAFGLTMLIPTAIPRHVLPDGDLFKQGSVRFSKGVQRFAVKQTNGNVAFANGGVVVAGLSWKGRIIYDPQGAKSYVGPMWKMQDRPNLQSDSPILDNGIRALLLDDATTYAGTYTTSNPIRFEQVDRSTIVNTYNREWRRPGEATNPASRATPLMALRKGLHFDEIDPTPYSPKVRNDGGNAQHLLELFLVPRNAQAARQVATDVGGGSTVTTVAVGPVSTGARQLPAALAGLVGKTILRGNVAGQIPGAVSHAGPSTVK